MVVTCKRDDEELVVRERCYEKALVRNITKRFMLDELHCVRTFTNASKNIFEKGVFKKKH